MDKSFNKMISVIVPIYNKEKQLEKCLDSIFEQKYVELQVILVDDGSTDKSRNICYHFLEDDRVELIEQLNQGVSVARNVGLAHAKGEWVAFVDPDDYLEKQCFYDLLNVANSNTDIVACCCNVISSDGIMVDYFFDKSFSAISLQEKKKLYLQLMNPSYGVPSNSYAVTAIGVPWGKLYRTSFIRENRLRFDKRLRRMQDNNFNMYAFEKAREIVYINEPLYNYSIDNIHNYVERKCRPWLEQNLKIFMQERNIFLKNSVLWNDSDIREFAYLEAIDIMEQGLVSGACHKDNNDSMKQKIAQVRGWIFDPIIVEAQNKLSKRQMKGKLRRVFYWSIKYKMPLLLYVMIKLKRYYFFIKRMTHRLFKSTACENVM